MKVFNERRLQRMRDARRQEEKKSAENARLAAIRAKTYEAGKPEKNVSLMLDALGLPIRRKLLARLQKGGAMSLSKLARPFGMTLTTALFHMVVLERSGFISTHKQGRTRMCVFRPDALRDLAALLTYYGI